MPSPQQSSPLLAAVCEEEDEAAAGSTQVTTASGQHEQHLPVGEDGEIMAGRAALLESVVVDRIEQQHRHQSHRGGSCSKLKYYDIVPPRTSRKSSQDINFMWLVDNANEWIAKTKDIEIQTCETITWMDTDPKRLGDSEQVILTKKCSQHAHTYYSRGLRLWYLPKVGGKIPDLSFVDYAPVDSADTIQSLISRANRKVEQGAFKGDIVSIETVSIPIINGNIDTNIVTWSEGGADDSPQAFVIRLFYTKAEHNNDHIGVKDFIPQLREDGYEGFEVLIDKANTWFKDQPDITITNFQSVMVQRDDGPHSETGSACFYTMPGLNSEHPVEFFRILRLAYSKPKGELRNGALAELPIIYPFTYENFTPEFVADSAQSPERIEKMKEMFSRVGNFLKHSGAELICTETVMNPMQLVTDDMNSPGAAADEIQWLFTLRVYTWVGKRRRASSFMLHADGERRGSRTGSRAGSFRRHSSRRKTQPAAEDSNENEHPGPIFLGNVTNKPFPYKMLVVGISVIVCMTIIVVVSVVYANKS